MPYTLDLIPVPAKTNTGFIKLKIDTKDLEGLKAYANTFDKHNVTISVVGMKITRENGELSYLVEIDEMSNGEYDYYGRQNKALEILKAYGAYSEGEFGVVASQYNAFEGQESRPEIFATPLSLLYYQDFNSTEALLDWYVMHKNRTVQVYNSKDPKEQSSLSKEWTIDAEDFEKTVTRYFDVTVDMLRNSDCYNAETKTYLHKTEAQLELPRVQIIKVTQKGDTMQISVHLAALNRTFLITAELNGDEFCFVDVKENVMQEVPSVFVTNLTFTRAVEKINAST